MLFHILCSSIKPNIQHCLSEIQIMWLEMSRDEEHGGPGWVFTECLWSPSHKKPSGKWPFWESLLSVRQGDIVFHLRGKTHFARFVGYSIADSNGYHTAQRPPRI